VAEEIESVAGRVAAGEEDLLTWFVVTFSDGDEEHRQGTLLEAGELASTHDLIAVPTPARSFRWVRDPDIGRVPHRATS
jgi:hypothetical protein